MLKRVRYTIFSCGALALLSGQPADAKTYQASNPNIPLLASTPSIIAAAAMGAYGAHGWTPNIAPWVTPLLNECAIHSARTRTDGITGLVWYEGLPDPAYRECNPEGIARVLSSRGTATGSSLVLPDQGWIGSLTFTAANGVQACDAIVTKMINYGTAVVLPMYSSWDHWVTVSAVDADNAPAGSGYLFDINTVSMQDGVATTDLDGRPSFYKVTVDFGSFHGLYWTALRFPQHTCQAANTCGTTYHDPWYRKYVMIYDPPAGSTLVGPESPTVASRAFRAPSTKRPGEQLSAALATQRVFNAVQLGRYDHEPNIAQAIAAGTPDQAALVSAVYPSGEPWPFYLVPIRNAARQVTALVQLSAEDGVAQLVAVPDHPLRYEAVDIETARARARSMLGAGEQLGAARLTWSPDVHNAAVHSPFMPYYELGIEDSASRPAGVIRVAYNGGKILGRSAEATLPTQK